MTKRSANTCWFGAGHSPFALGRDEWRCSRGSDRQLPQRPSAAGCEAQGRRPCQPATSSSYSIPSLAPYRRRACTKRRFPWASRMRGCSLESELVGVVQFCRTVAAEGWRRPLAHRRPARQDTALVAVPCHLHPPSLDACSPPTVADPTPRWCRPPLLDTCSPRRPRRAHATLRYLDRSAIADLALRHLQNAALDSAALAGLTRGMPTG